MYEFFQVVDELHSDPAIFPVLSAPGQPLPFELEPADGQARLVFPTSNISIVLRTATGWTILRTLRDLRFDVVITDARVVVYCEKWTKGGGWAGFGVGGVAFALAANAVSHARAAHRRKGKLMVAQVRYDWLLQAGAVLDRRGRPAAVRLAVDAGTPAEPRVLALDIPLDRIDPAKLAAELGKAAARYRLRVSHPLSEQNRQTCNQLAQARDRGTANQVWSVPGAVTVGTINSRPAAPGSAKQIPPPPEGTASAITATVTGPSPEPAHERSPGTGCRACGYVARLAATTCARCGLGRVESAAGGTGVATPAPVSGRGA